MATHLPTLLGSVSAVPDDSALSDLPRGQVDYLSHEWREEDVWRSWRNMTRLKNEIANGVRLENASWRTWWKQRNGLKTVTPETLNWLKDSDVTWLYGPLHTADPTPKPLPGPTAALDLSPSPSPSLGIVRKPILKHRSISELLLISEFPLSPVFSPPDSEEEDVPQIMSDGGDPDSPHKPIRPSLLHTKSDTHIARWGSNRPLRRDSPPRVAPNAPAELAPSSLLQADLPPASVVPGQKRKHISFNTCVEQCIAIDKPRKKRPHYPTSNPHLANWDDDGYDEDSEDGIIDEADEILFDDDRDIHDQDTSYPHIPHPHPPHHSPPPHNVSPPSSSTSEEDDDDDDDVLQMRVRHTASAPSPSPRSPSHSASSTSSSPRSRTPKVPSASCAPAGRRGHGRNGYIMRSQSTDKELVTIALIAPTVLKTKMDEDEDLSHSLSHAHLPSCPRCACDCHNDKDHSPVHGSPVELVYVPPSYVYSPSQESEDMVEEDTHTETSQSQPTRDSSTSGTTVDAADSKSGTCAFEVERDPVGPEVIISSSDGQPDIPRSRSHSRSRSRSRSRTPSPNEILVSATSSSATAVPRVNVSVQATGSIYLAPSDPAPSRGRSTSSSSLSSQVEQSRGRSITRTPSFSDRESINTGSPDAGLGIGSVGIRDRERDVKGEREARRAVERGRDRCTRRSGSHSGSGSSLSPENPHPAACPVVAQRPPEQAPVPEAQHYISGSSSSGSSTITVVSSSSTARAPPRLVVDAKPIIQTSYTEAPLIPISPSCAQEEQESISRQPTPANSPILAMHSPPPRHERQASPRGSRSPTRNGDDAQHGTLVGRAVEIMSNAGAFLGSFWHSGTPAGVSTS